MQIPDSVRRLKRRILGQPPIEYFPIDAWGDTSYEDWFLEHRASEEELTEQRSVIFEDGPMFSIVVPLYQTPIEYLTMMASSVLAQTYPHFELVLVDASPEDIDLAAAVAVLAEHDPRIKPVMLEGNMGIAGNTNAGIEACTGDFICFLDHDDFIEPDLLFEYAKAVEEDARIGVIYCDEDLVEVDGDVVHHANPLFKPAFSPEFLLCKNYIIHMLAVRSDIVREIGLADESYEGAQDYRLVLAASKIAKQVHGVQKVLYHWRVSSASTAANPQAKPYGKLAYRKSAYECVSERFPDAKLFSTGIHNIHGLWLTAERQVCCSIVVDCADAPDSIDAFLQTLSESIGSEGIEVVPVTSVIPSSNADPHGFDVCKTVVAEGGLFDRLDAGAKAASNDHLIFLSSTDMIASPDAIVQLSALCAGDGIGVASPKCLYSDFSLRTYGFAVTSECIMPLYRGYPEEFPGYQCNTRAMQDVSAASWRGLTISRDLFLSIGGFETAYEGEIGSADLCRKVIGEGLRIVQTPMAKVITSDDAPEERYIHSMNAPEFTEQDLALFDERWPGVRAAGDPYYNRNLDQSSEYFQIHDPMD